MTPADQERYLRLQARFDLIQVALAEKVGPKKAQAAAWAAWLVAIQHGIHRGLIRVAAHANGSAEEGTAAVQAIQPEMEAMLRGFHQVLCAYLAVDQEEARKLSKHFEQVIRDMIDEKG